MRDATAAARRLNYIQDPDPADTAQYFGEGTELERMMSTEDYSGEDYNEMRAQVRQLQALINEGRPIEAAELFLEMHPAETPGIAAEKRQLAVELFFINCKEENVFIAKSLFSRIHAVDKVTLSMWKALIIGLARKGCIESVATLYLQFQHVFEQPSQLIEIVLRSLIETRRLAAAKWFLYSHIRYDKGCGLAGIFLGGLWKKTRSLDLVEGQYHRLLKLLLRLEKWPTDKLFNPVIRAYIEFGKVGDAEALVDEMRTKYTLPLKCRTMGLLVISKALDCDWVGVQRDLDKMHTLGLTKDQQNFKRIFDRLFLEFWVSHTASEINDFIMRGIDYYGLVPDQVMYEHILEACIEKGNEDMVDSFVQLAYDRRWKVRVEDHEKLEMLRLHRLEAEQTPVGLWNLLQTARVRSRRASASRQIMGYDRASIPNAEVYRMPVTREPIAWYEKTLKDRIPTRPVNEFQRLDVRMSYFMHVGKLAYALKCFYNARDAGLHLKQAHLELAVVATLLLRGLGAAQAAIDEIFNNSLHKLRGYPIFFQQVKAVDTQDVLEPIKLGVFHFYRLCRDMSLSSLKHHVTVVTSRRLILKGRPELALDLLATVYKSRYGRMNKFDGTCMKMFLRAYAALGDLYGVRWCFMTSLARGSALNREMVVESRRVMMALELKFPNPNQTLKRKFRYLDYAVYLMERKSLGDMRLRGFRSSNAEKRYLRATVSRWARSDSHQFFLPFLARSIRRWDEEYELSLNLGERDRDLRLVAEKWREENVLEPEQVEYMLGDAGVDVD